MFQRSIELPQLHSCFPFGSRGTGKTTLLRSLYKEKDTLFIDLLDQEQESRLIRDPELLGRQVEGLPSRVHRVVIDEIQRAPRLLNSVHPASWRIVFAEKISGWRF